MMVAGFRFQEWLCSAVEYGSEMEELWGRGALSHCGDGEMLVNDYEAGEKEARSEAIVDVNDVVVF